LTGLAPAPATVRSAPRRPGAGWVTAAGGSGLLLIVVGYVTEQHYRQIEWHLSAPVPVLWWIAGAVAATLGGPLFFVAAGVALGRLSHRPLRGVLTARVLPYLGWYALATVTGTGVLLRFDPEFGLAPIHGTTGLLWHVVLPPAGLSLTYALALGTLLARLTHRLPAALVLGVAAAAAVLAAVAAGRAPDLLGAADLARYVLFLLLGWRLRWLLRRFAAAVSWPGFMLAAAGFAAVAGLLHLAGDATAWIRPLALGIAALPCGLALAVLLAAAPRLSRPAAAVGRAAAPVAALLLSVAAFADTVLLRRLSMLNATVQWPVAVTEPVLIAAAIVTGGLILHALTLRVFGRRRVAR